MGGRRGPSIAQPNSDQETKNMNFWKPLALVSMATTALVIGCEAHANVAATAPAAAPGPGPAPGRAGQPNMEAALEHLRAARGFLDRAEHDKGGWRVAAIRATQTAIEETQRGMAFD